MTSDEPIGYEPDDDVEDTEQEQAVPAVADEPTPKTATYKVTGPQRVHGVRRGGTLDLDPDSEQTRFLVDVGHICPATGADQED